MPRSTPAIISAKILRYCSGKKPTTCADRISVEEPLEIRVRGRSSSVTMRTPGQDKELAAGFLLSEGIIQRRQDIIEIVPCLQSADPENTLNVFLSPAVEVDFQRLTRHVFASSSCGLCGKASIEAVHQHFAPVESDLTVSAEALSELPVRMRAAQQTFAQTGGLHAAAIFNSKAELVLLREDVGRHNAVDKVIGHGFLENMLPFDTHVLLVSGR